jgi:hypothetical protein
MICPSVFADHPFFACLLFMAENVSSKFMIHFLMPCADKNRTLAVHLEIPTTQLFMSRLIAVVFLMYNALITDTRCVPLYCCPLQNAVVHTADIT